MNDRVSAAVIAAVKNATSNTEYADREVKPESTLEELGIDSLDIVEALVIIEEDLRIFIDDSFVTAVTVQDLIDITAASYREARP